MLFSRSLFPRCELLGQQLLAVMVILTNLASTGGNVPVTEPLPVFVGTTVVRDELSLEHARDACLWMRSVHDAVFLEFSRHRKLDIVVDVLKD